MIFIPVYSNYPPPQKKIFINNTLNRPVRNYSFMLYILLVNINNIWQLSLKGFLMGNLTDSLKKYLLIKHTQSKLKEYNKRISKTVPWIWRKGLMNNIETHCDVLLNSFLNTDEKQPFKTSKYIIDSILKYNIERSEKLIQANKKIKNMKSFMQLNSYIIFDEIMKGLAEHKNKKAIDFNIRMQLLLAQEKINTTFNVDAVLNEKIENKNICLNAE